MELPNEHKWIPLYEYNIRTLSSAVDEPFVFVGPPEEVSYLGERGIVGSLTDNTLRYYHGDRAMETTVSDREKAVVGYDAIDSMVNEQFERYESGDGAMHAITALTLIDMFDDYFNTPPSVLFDEVALAVAKEEASDHHALILMTLDAPDELRSRVLSHVRTQAKSCRSLEELYRIPLARAYLDAMEDDYGMNGIICALKNICE